MVPVRTGDHDGFGRVVFDLPPGVKATIAAMDGVLRVQLTGGAAGSIGAAPRNVRSIRAEAAGVAIALAPGVVWRQVPLAGKLVLDILTAGAPAAMPVPAMAAPAPARLWSGPAPRPRTPAAQAAAKPGPPPPPPDAAPPPAAHPPERPDGLAAAPAGEIAATPLAAPPSAAGPFALAASASGATLSLPFAASTGAAAFRRGREIVVVFDERRPLDLEPLHADPVYATARVQLLPAATVLRMTLPPGQSLQLARQDAGWSLAETPADVPDGVSPIRPEVQDGRLLLPAGSVGRVVPVPDPEGGGALLVGTQTQAGQGVAVARRTPEFNLLATLQGVVVEPASDAVALRPAPPGFVLQAEAGRALALDKLDAGAIAVAAAAHLTRRWDFPGLPADALLRRLQAAMESAAAAPEQSRTASRLAAVQAQLALGLGAEAHALAQLALSDDPRAAETPDAAALDAVAALLAGRFQEADALDDPRINGTDEVSLWRAARRAWRSEGAPDAAALFAATLPLVQSYPAALRQRLLPLAAETMALGGERDTVRRLLEARKDDESLDYARALLDEAENHAAPSLAMLDRLAQSPDRQLRARAAVRAVEQRLRLGALSPSAAAGALDKLIYAWRGDGQELKLRLRVAALRVQSGNWRAALALLRETGDSDLGQTMPDTQGAVRQRMQETFAQALAQDARAALPPLELVSLLEENPDLLPAGEEGRDLAARLAVRLTALDLPRRATPVLEKLMAATPSGAARAELGARLADLDLQQGEAAAALQALSGSAAAGLPADLEQRRTIAFARATAARGGLAPALAALAALDSVPAALEARASLHEAAKDWPAAAADLRAMAARNLPAEGPLDSAQSATLLRLASAAAQAGDETLLASLRDHDAARLPDGKVAEMFRLLTQRPVQSVDDLPRAAREAALARNFPAAMSSLAVPPPLR